MTTPTPHALPRARNTPALAALAVAVGLALGGQAHAATFTVTSNADSGAGSLRDAVAQANATAGADVIAFDAGIGATITLLDEIVIRESIAIVGPGAAALALDGNNATRIFTIVPESPEPPVAFDATISGLTLRNGFADDDGGCVVAGYVDLALVDSVVTGCVSGEGRGGGIALFEQFSTPPGKRGETPLRTSLRVTGSEISDNTADRGGGGISARIASFGIADGPVLQLLDSTVSGNAAGDSGGGVHFFSYLSADVELRDSIVSGNTATIPEGKGSTVGGGGGLAVEQRYVGQDSTVVVAGTRFLDNVASLQSIPYSYSSEGGGGGVWIGSSATIDVSETAFERNSVIERFERSGDGKRGAKGIDAGLPFMGGGLSLSGGYGNLVPALTVRNSAFVDNIAPYGGGLGTSLIFSSMPTKAAASTSRPLHADAAIAARMRAASLARPATKGVLVAPGVSVSDTRFIGNSAQGGAAVMNYLIDAATVAPPVKRGVAAVQSVFERVTMSGNTATFGPLFGAGALMTAGIGPITRVVDSTISGNTGGGIIVGVAFAEGETFTLDNSTVVDNDSVGLGAFFMPIGEPPQATWMFKGLAGAKAYPAQGEPLAVRNTILHGNLGGKGEQADIIAVGEIGISLLHTLIGQAQDDLPPFVDAGGNQFAADPLLGPLADNGGPTQTHLPLDGSPAIDAGDPGFATPPETDQRGEARVVGDALDIGAVEVAAAPAAPGTLQFDPSAATVNEADGSVTLTVTRVGGSDGEIGVNYATVAGTALAAADFTAASGTLSWADGDAAAKTFVVGIVDDSEIEPDELFTAALSAPTGDAIIGAADTATVTIVSDDAAPGQLGFVVTSVSVDEDAGTATLSVARTGGDSGPAAVNYASGNGTATAGSDYTAVSGTLQWAAADAAPKSIVVPITDDALDEADETFNVTLSGPTGNATLGATTATVTIVDNDDAPGTVGFDGADPDGVLRLRVREDGTIVTAAKGVLTITVSRTAGSGGPASVDYATVDGTATAPADYAATTGTLTWADGETGAKTIAIPIVEDDGVAEPDETFGIVLSNAQGAGLGGDSEAQVVIVANGTVVPPAAPAVIPAGDWRGKLALLGAMLLAGFVALRRRVF